MIGSWQYSATVMHQRIRPRRHRFSYQVNPWLVDLDEIDELADRLKLFSRNRFNLFAFYDRDYGDKSGIDLKKQVARHIQTQGVGEPVKVKLLCFPRVLGYVFNPLCIYFCYRADGSVSAILHEVSNTFGERHTYITVCNRSYQEGDTIRQRANKKMHVSPFMAMDYQYGFRLKPPGERLVVGINMADREGVLFTAVLKGEKTHLNNKTAAIQLMKMPFMTFKVMTGILWEAARLYVKGLKVYKHQPAKTPVNSSVGMTVE